MVALFVLVTEWELRINDTASKHYEHSMCDSELLHSETVPLQNVEPGK
jgi:hypothetical protein